eukprot:TRINITY_DN7756_c0_g2_i1.p2 TRINITY_DN7756_c0_g2~~TRINITY_DN7756_c0_g2_i1.p2  ORF type:complete len:214 (-),score=4.84 TRINITY_DN7756_c0_g2_i1:267-908(-)
MGLSRHTAVTCAVSLANGERGPALACRSGSLDKRVAGRVSNGCLANGEDNEEATGDKATYDEQTDAWRACGVTGGAPSSIMMSSAPSATAINSSMVTISSRLCFCRQAARTAKQQLTNSRHPSKTHHHGNAALSSSSGAAPTRPTRSMPTQPPSNEHLFNRDAAGVDISTESRHALAPHKDSARQIESITRILSFGILDSNSNSHTALPIARA